MHTAGRVQNRFMDRLVGLQLEFNMRIADL